MSSSATRRLKRFQEQQQKKFFDKQPKLKIPTEEELADYIMNKSKELRVSTPINKEVKEIQWDAIANKETTNPMLDL
jgi:ribosome-binding ATPase YchF (GTP1/OBG family)